MNWKAILELLGEALAALSLFFLLYLLLLFGHAIGVS